MASDHADLQANLGNGFAVETCKGGGVTASATNSSDQWES